MRRVCAWCGRSLDDIPEQAGREVTHGLCPACRERFFARAEIVKDMSSPGKNQIPSADRGDDSLSDPRGMAGQ